MAILSRIITFLPVLALLALAPAAYGQDASPWSVGHRSKVRLLAGGSDRGDRLAGVEIALNEGFKTYWRNPGEAGLPPSFDWSKSTNLETAELLWPAPARSEDLGGISYGYHGQVLFPVRVRPRDTTKPVGLHLKVDYGVCKDICIPAQAELSLKLGDTTASSPLRGLIEEALAKVPKPQLLNEESSLSILDARLIGGHKSKLMVTAKAPFGPAPTLFVEGPDNWFFQPTPNPAQIVLGPVSKQTFSIDVLERPPEGGRIDLRFTLVAGDKAIETTASLDVAPLER
jgi:DsbC/DsbD-like thiol-disulfide interchange protein